MFYTNATALKLLDHLTEFCLELHTFDAVNIPQVTKTLFSEAEGIPQFINPIESAHQKSKREKLVIHYEYMHAGALKPLLQSSEYETETWEGLKLPEDQKTWAAWKTTFQEAYVEKRRAEAAREGKEKTFGGSTIFGAAPEKTKEKLQRREHQMTAGPAPLTNQTMESLEGYLDNIVAAATQTAANGRLLTELAASLAISVNTFAIQQQEIKRLSEKIKSLKKKGTPTNSGATFPGGTTIICTHCEAVGRTEPHSKNACYFDPRKMMDRKDWERKLMEEKDVKCKDDE